MSSSDDAIDAILKKNAAALEENDRIGSSGAGGRAFSPYRRFLANYEDDDDGEGSAELKPDGQDEYEQRMLRREGEAKFASHVREARDPSETPDSDMTEGMGQGMLAHPLLADMPLGTEAPMERIDAMENDAAKIELKRKLENKLRAQHSSAPTYRR